VIDPSRDALIIVDVQNDFCPDGALGVPEGHTVVAPLNRYAERFAAVGAAIFATRDWHPERTTHFQEHGGPWPPHCVQGTAGAEFHGELRLPAGAVVLSKGMDPEEDAYSAFHARDDAARPLLELLRERGVRRLFVGGLATDYCVKATALDAIGQGFEVVVLQDAIGAVNLEPHHGREALEAMRTAGADFATLERL
jgi:nicotinamidase/pyrazinamidase